MKKTFVILAALAGGAHADVLLSQDFTTLSGYTHEWTDNKGTGETNDDVDHGADEVVTLSGWTTGQWNGTNDLAHYQFNQNGATVCRPWKQNYLTTNLDIDSQGDYTISFTLYNSKEDTGNMFFLSSDTYSIVIGNSYNSNSDIYVGTLNKAVGSSFVSFQTNTGINPTVLANSTDLNVTGDITYTLTMKDGDMSIAASLSSGGSWSTSIKGMNDVTFTKLGFISDGDPGTAGVKKITVIPEPTTATLSLLALAGLAARRRRK